MENKVLIPIPAELVAAIFNYLGTKPANEVEELRYGIRQADAEYARTRQAATTPQEVPNTGVTVLSDGTVPPDEAAQA